MPALNGDAGFTPIGGVWSDADLGDGDKCKSGKQKAKRQNCGAIDGVPFREGLWVKAVFGKKKEETPVAPAAPSNQELLLTEIRDLLKKN